MYYPPAGLDYCVFLHSSLGRCVLEVLFVTWLLPVGVGERKIV